MWAGLRAVNTSQRDLTQTGLESRATEGDSPVVERVSRTDGTQSSAGHVKPGVKQGGPPPKAKYYQTSDSEQVAVSNR